MTGGRRMTVLLVSNWLWDCLHSSSTRQQSPQTNALTFQHNHRKYAMRYIPTACLMMRFDEGAQSLIEVNERLF